MRKRFRQNSKKIIAASLVFWMSGFLFLFCCESVKAQSTETESCPLAKTQHCSKQSKAETAVSDSISIKSEQQTVECCRFLPAIFDKTRKVEKTQKVEARLASVRISQPKFSVVKQEFSVKRNLCSFVPDRVDTHLKNCVFRI